MCIVIKYSDVLDQEYVRVKNRDVLHGIKGERLFILSRLQN